MHAALRQLTLFPLPLAQWLMGLRLPAKHVLQQRVATLLGF